MLSNLLPLLVLLVVAWIWLAGARAREMATALAHRHCDNRNLQFLDETVSIARIGLRWTPDGIRVRRMFRFDYSLEGVGRRTGYILMLGLALEAIDDGLPQDEADAAQAATETGDEAGKVVPFRRRDD